MGKHRKPRSYRPGLRGPAGCRTVPPLLAVGQRTADDLDLDLGVGPIAGQGRGITGDGIEGIHGEQPMGAHQFDEAWAAMVLEDERPWIENGQPREATRHGWGGLPQETPDFMRSQLAQHQRATEGC